MKRLCVLSGVMILGNVTSLKSMEPERPATYQIIDSLSGELYSQMNWPAIFKILDEMQGVIDVNEYRKPDSGYTLLGSAVGAQNLLVAKELLEKYKANPNTFVANPQVSDKTPLMQACEKGDIPMMKLLLSYGADPNIKNQRNQDSFDYARNNAAALRILAPYNTGKPISQRPVTVRSGRSGRNGGGHSGARAGGSHGGNRGHSYY